PARANYLPAPDLTSAAGNFHHMGLVRYPGPRAAPLAPTRRGRLEGSAPLLVVVGATATLAYALRFGLLSADTVGVVQAADWILHGLRTGAWGHGGSRFPLLQTIPAMALRGLGLGVDQTRWGLMVLNAVAFVLLLGVSW